jgi:hypothetical protein
VLARLKALWLLTRAVLGALLGRARQEGDGLLAFRANYDAEGLPPVTVDEREALTEFGRCIACGLCDRGEAARIKQSGGAYRGLMPLMLAASRSMPDFRAAAYSFSFVSEEALLEKERGCPTQMPMSKVARFVRAKAEQVGGPLPLPPRIASLPPKHRLGREGSAAKRAT